jgi:hypothetical protein
MFNKLCGLLILFSTSTSSQLIQPNQPTNLKCPLGKVEIRTLSSLGFASKNTYDSTCQLALIYADTQFQTFKEIENEACVASRGEPVWGDIQYKPSQGQCSLVTYPTNPGYSSYDHEMRQKGICCRNKLYQNEPIIDLHWFSDPEKFCNFHFKGSTDVVFSNQIHGSHTDITCPNAIRGAIQKLNEESDRQEQNCIKLGGSYKLIKVHITPACSSFSSITSNDKRVHNVAFANALCCKGCKDKNNTNEYGGEVPELDLELDDNDFERYDDNNNTTNTITNTTTNNVIDMNVDQLYEDAKNKYIINTNNNYNNSTDLSKSDYINIDYINYLLFFGSFFLFIINY